MLRRARSNRWLVPAAGCLLLLAGCATQPEVEGSGLPGFFKGMLHGFLILFSLVGSIFTDVRIYAYPNAGGWYDFGFVLGVMALLGGGGASVRS